MGLYASFRAIDADAVQAWKDEPGIVERLQEEEDASGESPAELGELFEVDKAWHGLHFLLNAIAEEAGAGEDAPLAQAIFGGTELSEDEDVRVMTPAEVRAVADALAAITTVQLREAYDPPAMAAADIYPKIWVRDGEEALDYLVHHFPTLVEFYRSTAASGKGALISIS